MALTPLQKSNLRFDIAVIVASVFLAVLLAQSGAVDRLALDGVELAILGNILAGAFFTSAFTTAPSIAVLGALVNAGHSVWWVAFFGGVGAVLGDLIIFRFVRDRLTEDVLPLIGLTTRERLREIFSRKLFRWFTPLVGAFIIASPLPDELGIALLGVSKTRTLAFIPFSFAANFVGILVVAELASLVT